MLTRVDVFGTANAQFVGAVREVNVTAVSGSLAVSLAATADNAILAAMEVSGPRLHHSSVVCRA